MKIMAVDALKDLTKKQFMRCALKPNGLSFQYFCTCFARCAFGRLFPFSLTPSFNHFRKSTDPFIYINTETNKRTHTHCQALAWAHERQAFAQGNTALSTPLRQVNRLCPFAISPLNKLIIADDITPFHSVWWVFECVFILINTFLFGQVLNWMILLFFLWLDSFPSVAFPFHSVASQCCWTHFNDKM